MKYLIILISMCSLAPIHSQSCIEMQTYGNDNDCSNPCSPLPYDGENGIMVLPIKFHISSQNSGANFSQLPTMIDELNKLYHDYNGLPIKFVQSGDPIVYNTFGENYCQYTCGIESCDNLAIPEYYIIRDIAKQNSDALNIFMFHEIFVQGTMCSFIDKAGNASYPSNSDPMGSNNYIVLENSYLNDVNFNIVGHEIGHLLGLFHTFETKAFEGNQCEIYDGILDTGDPNNSGFDDKNSNTTSSCNLMDQNYNDCSGYWNITSCQKAKILDVILQCRSQIVQYELESESLQCFDIVYVDYTYECGNNQLVVTIGEEVYFEGRNCGSTTTSNPNTNGNGNTTGPGSPGNIGGPKGTTVSPGVDVPVVNENEECHECLKELQRKVQLLQNQQNGGN